MGHGSAHGMTDEARRRWKARRFASEMATEAAREAAAEVPSMPWTGRRTVEETAEDEAEPVIETERARRWMEEKHGKIPSPAKSLRGLAVRYKFDVTVAWSHQERRGAHGRLLDPPEADFCSVLGIRGDIRFVAEWAHVYSEKTEKWSWKAGDVLVWAPGLAIQPSMVKITELKKEHLR